MLAMSCWSNSESGSVPLFSNALIAEKKEARTKGLSPDNCIIRLAASGRRYSSSHRGSWRVGC